MPRIAAAIRILIAIWALAGFDPAIALSGGQTSLLLGRPGWVLSGASRANLNALMFSPVPGGANYPFGVFQ